MDVMEKNIHYWLHYIYDSIVGKFIKVQDYSGAKVTNKKSKLSCLITNTHKIPVGEQTFWDWEVTKYQITNFTILNLIIL